MTQHSGDDQRSHVEAAARGSRRIQFIDAARGSAMLFVLLAHFNDKFFVTTGFVPEIFAVVGLIASPTFMGLSGLVMGFLHKTRGPDFERIRTKLIDRGLFLLTIGHAITIMAIGGIYSAPMLLITDTIGVCMIVGPALVTRVRPRTTLLIASAMYVVSWIVILTWRPESGVLIALKEATVGAERLIHFRYAFPIVPWMAVFLAGSVIGNKLATLYQARNDWAITRLLAGASISSLTVSIGGHFLAERMLRVVPMGARATIILDRMTARIQKVPPGPVYLLFHAGIGLALLLVWFWIERRGAFKSVTRFVASLGQVSLMMFLTQFYVYYILMHLFNPHAHQWAWPLYLSASIPMVVMPAYIWHNRGYNRFITVRYPQIIEPLHLWQKRLRAVLAEGIAPHGHP